MDLGLGPVLARLEASNGGLAADACRKTVRTIVRNCAENVEHQITKVHPLFSFLGYPIFSLSLSRPHMRVKADLSRSGILTSYY